MKKLTALLLAALLLAGCASNPVTETTPDDTQEETKANASAPVDTTDLFTDRDYRTDYDESDCTVLTLSGEAVIGSGADIDGGTVTITEEGSYLLRGTLDNGQIIVDVEKTEKVQLILADADITSATSAPIYVRQADKVFITLAGENSLTNGGSFEAIDDNDIDAVIFSKEDLTLNGSGSLAIASPAGHGIVSKDELTVTGGTYHISCASHAVCGKDNLCIAGGTFTIAAGKDGLHAENNDDASLGFAYIADGSFTISAEGDGIAASGSLEIHGGTFDITTGGGSENGTKQVSDGWGQMGGGRGGFGGMGGGMGFGGGSSDSEDSESIKGIKAASDLTISGGTFTLNCADDAVHSNTNVTISGGDFDIATGDDGFHADDTLTIENGTIDISESYEGLEGLHILVSGGDISLISSDDGLNAAGGNDSSGMGGRDQFGGGKGGPGGMGGGMSANSDGTIVISGGSIYMEASGDGIDANGTLEITGGFTVVTGPTQGDTATLDYDLSATISGGTFIGTGASGMAQTFSDGSQGIIAVSLGGSASAGTELILTDAAGKEVVRFTPNLSYAVVILSTPEMVSGETYTITVGTASGEFQAS